MLPLARTAAALLALSALATPAAAQGYRPDTAPGTTPAAETLAEAALRPAPPLDLAENNATVVHIAYADNHVRWCLRNHPGYSPRSDSFPAPGGTSRACVSPYD